MLSGNSVRVRERAHVGLRSGFSLFEAIVVLAILSLVAIGTLAAVGTQLRATDHARHTTEAAALAEERLAVVEQLSASDLQSLPEDIVAGHFAPPLNAYQWRVTSRPVSSENYLNAITVQISWPSGAYTLTSRVYRAPPNVQVSGADAGGPGGGGVGRTITVQLGGGGFLQPVPPQ